MLNVPFSFVDPSDDDCQKLLPKAKTAGAAGVDLVANETALLLPMQPKRVRCGFKLGIPRGWEGQVRGRSGLALDGLWVPFGTIDSDYRGEVCVTLINFNATASQIRRFDRIAQLIIAPVVGVVFDITEKLDETERGVAGYGSTGR